MKKFRFLLISLAMSSLLSLIIVACKSSAPAPEDSKNSKPVAGDFGTSMRQLKDALSNLDPYLVDEKKFSDPNNEKIIQAQIQKMNEISKTVVHNPTTATLDPTLRFVSTQFQQDLQRSSESFDLGKKDFSRYQLLKVTSYCIECHTRTAQGPQFESPIDNKNILHLDRVSRAEYYISTRYFDQALKLLEDELKDNAVKNATEMDKLARYGLLITVQYQQNPNHALEFVSDVSKQKDISMDITKKISVWKRDLTAWKNEGGSGIRRTMDFYRKLAKNHESEVSQMRVLSGLLSRISTQMPTEELGESLYLIGQSYSFLSEVSPIPLQEDYFEACIHSAQHTVWAKKCYKSLQNEINFGYSGSGGTHIPSEVQEHLDKLRALL